MDGPSATNESREIWGFFRSSLLHLDGDVYTVRHGDLRLLVPRNSSRRGPFLNPGWQAQNQEPPISPNEAGSLRGAPCARREPGNPSENISMSEVW